MLMTSAFGHSSEFFIRTGSLHPSVTAWKERLGVLKLKFLDLCRLPVIIYIISGTYQSAVLYSSESRGGTKFWIRIWIRSRVADPHYLNADPDPSFNFNADTEPSLHQSYANLRPPVYRPSMAPFLTSRPRLWASMALHGSILNLLKLLNFECHADPDPAFNSNADWDPASPNNAYPCESGSAALIRRHGNNEYGSVILQILCI